MFARSGWTVWQGYLSDDQAKYRAVVPPMARLAEIITMMMKEGE
ncbi:hypothetical protein ACQEXU_20330 [Vibrio sp. TRT 21S02]